MSSASSSSVGIKELLQSIIDCFLKVVEERLKTLWTIGFKYTQIGQVSTETFDRFSCTAESLLVFLLHAQEAESVSRVLKQVINLIDGILELNQATLG